MREWGPRDLLSAAARPEGREAVLQAFDHVEKYRHLCGPAYQEILKAIADMAGAATAAALKREWKLP